MGKKIVVDFSSTSNASVWIRPERKYGGCGLHEKIEDWKDGVILKLDGYRGGRERKFIVTHRRSSTGSGLGSFRIDEAVGDGKIVTHGYHCSYPDFDACVLVARGSTHH